MMLGHEIERLRAELANAEKRARATAAAAAAANPSKLTLNIFSFSSNDPWHCSINAINSTVCCCKIQKWTFTLNDMGFNLIQVLVMWQVTSILIQDMGETRTLILMACSR